LEVCHALELFDPRNETIRVLPIKLPLPPKLDLGSYEHKITATSYEGYLCMLNMHGEAFYLDVSNGIDHGIWRSLPANKVTSPKMPSIVNESL
jgi:hypothetical protein